MADGILDAAATEIVVKAGDEVLATLDSPRVRLGVCDTPLHLPPTKEQREITITLTSGEQKTSATLTQYPERLWRIYVAPSTHTDIGYTDVQAQAPLQFDQVSVPGGTGLDDLARTVGVDAEVLYDLNPHLVKKQTPPDRRMAVRVPLGQGTQVAAALDGAVEMGFWMAE